MPRHSSYIKPYLVLNSKGEQVAQIARVWTDYTEPKKTFSGRKSKKTGFYIWQIQGLGKEIFGQHCKQADAFKEAKGNGYRIEQWDGLNFPEWESWETRPRPSRWIHWASHRNQWQVWNTEKSNFDVTTPLRSGSV